MILFFGYHIQDTLPQYGLAGAAQAPIQTLPQVLGDVEKNAHRKVIQPKFKVKALTLVMGCSMTKNIPR